MPDEIQTGTFDLNANPATNPLNTGNGVSPAVPAAQVAPVAPITPMPAPTESAPIQPIQITITPQQSAPIQQIPEAAPNIDLDKQLESQLADIEQSAPKERKVLNYKNLILLGISIVAIGISVFIIFKILGASRSEQAASETVQETTPPPEVENPFPEETTTEAPSDAMIELEETATTLEENVSPQPTTEETPPGLTISPEETTTQDSSVKRAR